MRKITRLASLAFRASKPFSMGNTAVTHDKPTGITQMRLHGNLIAERMKDGRLRVSLAGWNTPTTRERLNGLLEMLVIAGRFHQRDWEPFFKGERINSDDWLVITRD